LILQEIRWRNDGTAGGENFYALVGSSAGALIGWQFVVITLVADRPALRTAEAGAAFATPSVVHFGTALLLAVVPRS
jgi:uncharacterized membrane protein